MSVVVQTRAGAVRGVTQDGISVFRGIPFAAPPVGPRRFQAPESAQRWDGIREADVFGPPPPQSRAGLPTTTVPAGPIRHDPTDWLTLNIWTPDPGATNLPVLVWIYGGAYRFGSSGDYDGRLLAGSGVVIVTGNHRVGVEGYAQLDGAPANRGLLDQVAILRWVQAEIAAFGGDPSRVTIFGESSGAGTVAALSVMPSAVGLFTGAIAQSVAGTFFTTALARDISAELVAPLGLEPSAAALADVEPDRLLAALSQLDARMPTIERWGMTAHSITPFSPVIDGTILPIDPWQGLACGVGRDVALMVGHNRDEWQLFHVMSGRQGQVTDEMATATMEAYGPGPDAPARLRAAYPGASAEELSVIVLSDRMFRVPSQRLAAAQTAGGGRAYLYELTWQSPGAGGLLRACHGLDVPLVFGALTDDLARLFVGSPPDPGAIEVSAQMRGAWVAFARDGDPGWPTYDERQRLTRVFDCDPNGGVRPYPEEASRELWAAYEIELADLSDTKD
jgi:para-nitrobenzyl esterase